MASNIISDTIDAAYPVAGVDNDTQGFRDNFTVIKTGLATATSEISTLQSSTCKAERYLMILMLLTLLDANLSCTNFAIS